MNASKSPVVTELEYIDPLCTVLESGRTTIISRTPCECAPDRLRHMNFLRPLRGADGIPVQSIDDRIATGLRSGVAGRQEDNDLTVDAISFEIAFQGSAVNLDVLHRYGLGARQGRRDVGLHLCRR